jgi:uncharacterized protein YjbI with pentapeptide repeats
MFDEHDFVRLKRTIPVENVSWEDEDTPPRALEPGESGTIVMVFPYDSLHADYMVEFSDDEGYMYALPTLKEEDLEVIQTWRDMHQGRKPPSGALLTQLSSHRKWLDTREEEGKQLQLDGADLSELYLAEPHLAEADLPRTNFDGALLSKADLYGAYLVGSSFRRACLDEARLEKAEISDTTLVGASLRSLRGIRADFTGADLRDADLSKANLFRARFTNADLRGTSFREASLASVSFNRADLTGADLTGALLDGMVLLSDTKGLEAVKADWINVGTNESPRILEGDKAKKWLLELAAPAARKAHQAATLEHLPQTRRIPA